MINSKFMKSKNLLLVWALCILFSLTAGAQKISLKTGKADVLKKQTALKVQFVYENMKVGKYAKEEEYVAEKIKEYNSKEAGKGDKWAESWKTDRERSYEPKFIELLSKELAEKGVAKVGKDVDASYTFIVKTTRIEPGFNVGVMRKNAEIDLVVDIVETANPSTVVATIEILKSPGRDVVGVDFDNSWRIAEAYAKAGKELGQFIAKKL
jgi:hypothetical protein